MATRLPRQHSFTIDSKEYMRCTGFVQRWLEVEFWSQPKNELSFHFTIACRFCIHNTWPYRNVENTQGPNTKLFFVKEYPEESYFQYNSVPQEFVYYLVEQWTRKSSSTSVGGITIPLTKFMISSDLILASETRLIVFVCVIVLLSTIVWSSFKYLSLRMK